MRLLDRYLLREVLVPLGYCLVGFLIFWICFDLFAELADFQKKQLLVRDIVEFYLVITPEFLVIVLPIALLLAMLYSLTDLARHQEITAIRAAGVSLWRLSLPYFMVGLLASLVLGAINEFWVPDSSEAARQIMARRLPRPPGALARHQVRDLCFNNARDGHIWHIGVYNTITAEMTNPQVTWTLPDGSVRWVHATRGVRTNGAWVFYEVIEYKEVPETNSFPTPSLRTNILAYPDFTETPEQIKSQIKLADSIVAHGAKKADLPILEILDYLRLNPNLSRSDRFWINTKLHGRFAAPWTCLVVVLIAIPFGAASGRRNVFVGVAGSILICFSYFVLQQVGLALGTGGYVPPWLAAWFPNLFFGLLGLCLTALVR
jgi:lipopolysaccharide export system permease protein